jgi:biotin transport system substrate-specific component
MTKDVSTRDIVYIALFAALMAAINLVPAIQIGFLPVPITAQTLGVMLAGSLIGAKRGGLAAMVGWLSSSTRPPASSCPGRSPPSSPAG